MALINKDEFAMSVAYVTSLRSKDPNTKVGSVIVDDEYRILSTGYNGFTKGMFDTEKMWEKPIKYTYVVHSEINAILNSRTSVAGNRIFTTKFPCVDCTKAIIQAGLKEVITSDQTCKSISAQLLMFSSGDVKLRYMNFNREKIQDCF